MSLSSSHANARPISPNGKPCTVLYVEDNADNLALVEEILARQGGMQFLAAIDGPTGIALARKHKPDVILLDINMPGMSGTAVLQVLLMDPQTACIPIIALSSNAYPRQVEKGLESGFFDYMTKPFMIAELEAVVEAAFAHSIAKKNSQQ